MIWIIVLLCWAFLALIGWAVCAAAGMADDAIERME